MVKSKNHVLITNFNGNPNVGLYGYVTDKYCLIASEVSEKLIPQIEEALHVKCIQMSIAGTGLLGVFLTGNKNRLLVPKIAFENELAILDKHKIKYTLIDTKFTCLGNNIVCTDFGCVVSKDYGEREIKQFAAALKVPVVKATIADHHTLGSLAVHSSKHMLCHHEIMEHEAELIEKTLQLQITTGTVNMGVPFVGSGILCNKYGFIIGDHSGGPEIVNADEALGFTR